MRTSRILVLGLLASAALTAHAQPGREPPERWQRMTPEQREQIWRGLPPDQKLELWRRLPPAERQVLRERMTPEQREAMRERWLEERARRFDDGDGLR
ncbi:MAG: DUF3106 domain-containing protein, partial [Burkholderiaceae bacterium]|nr:DUF3106 domain-containing protein [Burkholderiaceae bacterium]